MSIVPVKTRTAEVELLASGVTVVRIDPKAEQTIEDARENISMAVSVGGDWLRPLLVDVRGGKPLEAEVRHYYSGQILIESFAALCMLVDISPLGQMMGNLYMRVAKPGIPAHLSNNELEALNWLGKFTNEKRKRQ